MAMKDIYHFTSPAVAIRKAFATTDTATAVKGNAIDTLGFDSLMFVVTSSSADDTTTYALSIEHSDDGTDYTDASSEVYGEFLLGPSDPVSGAANIQKIGYLGARRYVKLVVTPSAAPTEANTVVGLAIRQNPCVTPV